MNLAWVQQPARQRTLSKRFDVEGKGVHTGETVSMTIHAAEPDVGICFLRADQPPSRSLVLARWSSVVCTRYCVDIGNADGVTVRAVTHLMAALRLAGVDNAIVELKGPEVPALDGSAAPFLNLTQNAGVVEQDAPTRAITLSETVEVREDDRFVRLVPSHSPSWTVSIDFPKTVIGTQLVSFMWNDGFLKREVAPARAFGFASEHASLMASGYALGADLTNTVVIDGESVLNPEGLRYRDEFVRHKTLDAIGDLSLAGYPIRASYEAFKPGHALNIRLLAKLFKNPADAGTLFPSGIDRPRAGQRRPNR